MERTFDSRPTIAAVSVILQRKLTTEAGLSLTRRRIWNPRNFRAKLSEKTTSTVKMQNRRALTFQFILASAMATMEKMLRMMGRTVKKINGMNGDLGSTFKLKSVELSVEFSLLILVPFRSILLK